MKKAMKVLMIILVIIVILFVVAKRLLFSPYEEIEVTGKYEIDCEDYWVTEDKEDPFLKDGSENDGSFSCDG